MGFEAAARGPILDAGQGPLLIGKCRHSNGFDRTNLVRIKTIAVRRSFLYRYGLERAVLVGEPPSDVPKVDRIRPGPSTRTRRPRDT